METDELQQEAPGGSDGKEGAKKAASKAGEGNKRADVAMEKSAPETAAAGKDGGAGNKKGKNKAMGKKK